MANVTITIQIPQGNSTVEPTFFPGGMVTGNDQAAGTYYITCNLLPAMGNAIAANQVIPATVTFGGSNPESVDWQATFMNAPEGTYTLEANIGPTTTQHDDTDTKNNITVQGGGP